jgi:hypothetical protein
MNKRTLLIFLALLAPVAMLALMMKPASVPAPQPVPVAAMTPAPAQPPSTGALQTNTMPPRPRPPATLDEARAQAKVQLDYLNRMTPQQWDDMQKKRAVAMQRWAALPEQEKKRLIEGFRPQGPGALAPAPEQSEQLPESN